MNFLFARKIPETTLVTIASEQVLVAVKLSERARSYRLTVPHSGPPVLTVPRHGKWADAQAFLGRHLGWLEQRLRRAAPRVPLAEGSRIPVRGVPHLVTATGRLRGRVEVADDDGEPLLLVPGAPEHHARRLEEWLKAEAHRDLAGRSEVHAQTLGVVVKSVAMRSQATRWGSCSSTGRLNYNWRLILAPPFVLDYVAAHEVAHLVHMNHSISFWRSVEQALPDMARGRAWLKAHGKELMAIGG